MTDVNINAQVRGNVRQAFITAQQNVQPILTEGGEQYTVEALPPAASIVALGNSWQSISGAVAALTALPTTTAGFTLYNGETGSTPKSLLIESFGWYQGVIDATQIDSAMLVAMMGKKTDTIPSGGAATTNTSSLAGKGSYNGAGVLRSGGTVVNNIWFPHGTLYQSQSPTLAGDIFKVYEAAVRPGMYIVAPGAAFSFTAVKSVAAAASQVFYFIRWHEVYLNLG